MSRSPLTGHDLREIAAKIVSLDLYELKEAGVIVSDNGGSDWDRWDRDPLIFICKLPADRREILARLLA